ncbi:MAG: O-antigen ligase family protein [Caldilineaceae bacterium]
MRAYGSYNQPNPYAGYLGLTLPVALSLLLCSIECVGEWRAESGNRHISRLFALQSPISWLVVGGVSSSLIGLGLLLSWSRGGWFGALAALAVVIFLRNRKSAMIGVVILVTLALLVLAGSIQPSIVPAPIASRLSDLPTYLGLTDVLSQPLTDENFAVVERIAHWVAAVRMWERSPWIGVGPGNYAVVYPVVKVPGWDEALGHAHNIYLNVLAESGLLGFFAYLGFWLLLGGWSLRQWSRAKRDHDAWRSALILGVLAIFVHLAVHNIFDNLFVQGIYLHLALWIAVLYPMRSYRESR